MDSLNAEKVTTESEIETIIKEKILSKFCKEYALIGEDRTTMPAHYLKFAEQIKNFQVLDDDIWITTYPKTGTTWAQEMVWMIMNNLDFQAAKEFMFSRFPFLELSGTIQENELYAAMKFDSRMYKFNSVEFTAKQESRPRFIKTHLPLPLLPDQIKNGTKRPKIIYAMRNPKDTCVSFCHHGNIFLGWRIDPDSFAKLFIAEKSMYGSFWKHVFGFWEHRDSLNILFINYEDMKADLPSVIRKVAKFLKKELTEEQIEILAKHLSFESMKKNGSVNLDGYVRILKSNGLTNEDGSFIRIGKVGNYKEELSPEVIKQLDAWIKKNIAGTSLESEPIFNI